MNISRENYLKVWCEFLDSHYEMLHSLTALVLGHTECNIPSHTVKKNMSAAAILTVESVSF